MNVAETPAHANKKQSLQARQVPSKPSNRTTPLLAVFGKERPAEELMIPDCFESTECAADRKSMIPVGCLSFKPRKRMPEFLDLDHVEGSLKNLTIDERVTSVCVSPDNFNGRNGSILMAPQQRCLSTKNKKNTNATTIIRKSVRSTTKSLPPLPTLPSQWYEEQHNNNKSDFS